MFWSPKRKRKKKNKTLELYPAKKNLQKIKMFSGKQKLSEVDASRLVHY